MIFLMPRAWFDPNQASTRYIDQSHGAHTGFVYNVFPWRLYLKAWRTARAFNGEWRKLDAAPGDTSSGPVRATAC